MRSVGSNISPLQIFHYWLFLEDEEETPQLSSISQSRPTKGDTCTGLIA